MPATQTDQIQGLLSQTIDLLIAADDPAISQLADSLPTTAHTPGHRLSIAFAGPYSAGKSTLLQALTGDTTIAIGAGITTDQLQELEWQQILLLDTPGLHTEIRPAHDALSLKALTEADLLIFVITNELFDSSIIAHYNQLAESRDKAAETLLVINKMSRHVHGNTPESQATIKTDLAQVLPPAQLENIAFIDAKDAVTAAQETDPARKARLHRRSNFDEFTDRLERFIQEKSATGARTTVLYQIERALTQAQELTDQDRVKTLLETENLLQQQKEIVAEAIDAWITAASNFNHHAQQQVHDLQEQALTIYTETGAYTTDNNDKAETALNKIADELQQQIIDSFKAHHDPLDQNLNDLWGSPRGRNIHDRLRREFNNKSGKFNIPGKAKPLTGLFTEATANSGSLSSLSGVSGSAMHETVLTVGNFLGKNFRPWEAIKLARGLGTAAAIAGPILTIGLQVWEDHQEAKRQEKMRQDRADLISIFQDVGNNLNQDINHSIHQMERLWRQESIDPVDAAIAESAELRQQYTEWQQNAINLQNQARALIQQIHQQGS